MRVSLALALVATTLICSQAFQERIPQRALHDVAEDSPSTHHDGGGNPRIAVCITLQNEGQGSLLFIDGAAILRYSILRTQRCGFHCFQTTSTHSSFGAASLILISMQS